MTETQTFQQVIGPKLKISNYWKELWSYRELFYFLAKRDILVRYKQTTIGIAWSVIRPLLTMVILTVIFGTIGNLTPQGIPSPLFIYAGELPWLFFASSFSDASNSLIINSNMLTKVYFPRIVMPISTIIVNLVDFVISFIIFIGLMIGFNYIPSSAIASIPLFIFLSFLPILGAGILVSALNVKYRDFRYIVPFIVQFGIYISPIGFDSSKFGIWRILVSINPMVGVIDGFRWAIFGISLYLPGFFLSLSVAVMLLIVGVWYFSKTEADLADFI